MKSITEKASAKEKCDFCEKGELHQHFVIVDKGIRNYLLGLGDFKE